MKFEYDSEIRYSNRVVDSHRAIVLDGFSVKLISVLSFSVASATPISW